MTIPHDMKNITPPTRYVCYYRVSTQRQGESGLGLEAQRAAVLRFIEQRGGIILDEVTETESGKKVTNRPQLQHALALCRKNKATGQKSPALGVRTAATLALRGLGVHLGAHTCN